MDHERQGKDMNEEIQNLLYTVPVAAQTYTDDLSDLDKEDIPRERIPRMKAVMRDGEDAYDSLRAGIVLASWGDDDGFSFLEEYVFNRQPSSEVLMPHRLWGYDDSPTQVLSALVSYWATLSDDGQGELARSSLFRPVSRIIQLSNVLPFEIAGFFPLIRREGYVEYLPAIKEHFAAILKDPRLHHWKIVDCAKLLMQFDASFVEKSLAAHGKTLADFQAP